jgi:hypothetical protein
LERTAAGYPARPGELEPRAALVVAPVALLGGAGALSKLLAGDGQRSIAQIAVNYAYTLVPFGFLVLLLLVVGSRKDKKLHA